MAQSRAPKPGGNSARTIGPYELICELSRGFFAPLWAAHDPSGRADPPTVIVRRIRAPRPRSPVMDKLHEAAQWAERSVDRRLPSVVQLIRDGDGLDVLYAFADGEPFRNLLRNAAFKRAPIPVAAALRIAVDVLIQLDAVHQRAQHDPKLGTFTFGGLQPDSIWVGADGVTRLLDIGIAPIAANTEPWSHDPLRVAYSSPEQLKRTPELSPRMDVFSMATMLWEMIANRRLFPGASDAMIREKIAKQNIGRLDDARATGGVKAPAAVADVIAHALQREPSDRHASVRALASALCAAHPLADHRDVGALLESLADSSLEKRRTSISKAGAATTAPGFLLELTDPEPVPDEAPAAAKTAPSPKERVSVRPPPVAVHSRVPPPAPSQRASAAGTRPSVPPRASRTPPPPPPPRTSAVPSPPRPPGRVSALPPKAPEVPAHTSPTIAISEGPSTGEARASSVPPPPPALAPQERPAQTLSSVPPPPAPTASPPTSSVPPSPEAPAAAAPASPPSVASSEASPVPPAAVPPPLPPPLSETTSTSAEPLSDEAPPATTSEPRAVATSEPPGAATSEAPAAAALAADLRPAPVHEAVRARRQSGRRALWIGLAALLGVGAVGVLVATSRSRTGPSESTTQTPEKRGEHVSTAPAVPHEERPVKPAAQAPEPTPQAPESTAQTPEPAATATGEPRSMTEGRAAAPPAEEPSREGSSPKRGGAPAAAPQEKHTSESPGNQLHRPTKSGSVPDESYEPGGI